MRAYLENQPLFVVLLLIQKKTWQWKKNLSARYSERCCRISIMNSFCSSEMGRTKHSKMQPLAMKNLGTSKTHQMWSKRFQQRSESKVVPKKLWNTTAGRLRPCFPLSGRRQTDHNRGSPTIYDWLSNIAEVKQSYDWWYPAHSIQLLLMTWGREIHFEKPGAADS